MISLESKTTCANTKEKKQFKVPHTLVIVTAILVLVAIATWLIPAGNYERVVNELGNTVVVNDSFSYVESTPQGLFKLLQAPINGIVGAAEIIAFLFIVSGSIAIITKTRAIDAGITSGVKSFLFRRGRFWNDGRSNSVYRDVNSFMFGIRIR